MQQILHQLRTKGDENFEEIYDQIPFLPPPGMKVHHDLNADQSAVPRVYKSHSLYEDIPKVEGRTRFVVVIRDPYDSELSYLKFLWRYIGIDKDVSPEEYEKITASNQVGDFATFISGWWPRRHNPNILFTPYEDLKLDLASCIQKISTFIFGQPMEEPAFSKILHMCSFEYMAQHREKFRSEKMMQFWTDEAKVDYKPVSGGGMVRLDGGQVGQGRVMLDEAVRRYIDKRWKEIVEKEHGIKNYQELYKIWETERDQFYEC